MRQVALDVHQGFCEVAIREDGKTRSAGRVVTGRDTHELFAQSLSLTDEVVTEATGPAISYMQGLLAVSRYIRFSATWPWAGLVVCRTRNTLCMPPGSHQLQSPSKVITAGTRASLMSVASIPIAIALPSPISLMIGIPVATNTAKTHTIIAAAPVIVLALTAIPSAMA